MFLRKKKTFELENVPSIRFEDTPIEVDISFLAEDDHANAFVDIFEKAILDNRCVLEKCSKINITAKYDLGAVVDAFNQIGSIEQFRGDVREIARELYMTNNDHVTLKFSYSNNLIKLFVVFDNPYFRVL